MRSMFEVTLTLRAVRSLLADPARWCQGWVAENARGEPVNPDDEDVQRLCLLGALQRVNPPGDALLRTVVFLREGVPGGILSVMNDASDHATVLRVLDDAIRHSEKIERHRILYGG